MIKFILVMQLCVNGLCYPPLPNDIFDSYKGCIIAGYEESLIFINDMDEDNLNKSKPIIRFWCQEEKQKGLGT
jgi:hypothetical protein|tara:strand:- start:198 stop:416 length:219 start_codon:yes stop_codon:yes gene_type:complete